MALTTDFDQGVEVGPLLAGTDIGKAVRVSNRPALTDFITTMTHVGALYIIGREPVRRGLFDMTEQIDRILVKMFLIFFERSHIIGLLVADRFGNFFLAAHRLNGHNTAV